MKPNNALCWRIERYIGYDIVKCNETATSGIHFDLFRTSAWDHHASQIIPLADVCPHARRVLLDDGASVYLLVKVNCSAAQPWAGPERSCCRQLLAGRRLDADPLRTLLSVAVTPFQPREAENACAQGRGSGRQCACRRGCACGGQCGPGGALPRITRRRFHRSSGCA